LSAKRETVKIQSHKDRTKQSEDSSLDSIVIQNDDSTVEERVCSESTSSIFNDAKNDLTPPIITVETSTNERTTQHRHRQRGFTMQRMTKSWQHSVRSDD
jgi:hypothetical protein